MDQSSTKGIDLIVEFIVTTAGKVQALHMLVSGRGPSLILGLATLKAISSSMRVSATHGCVILISVDTLDD
jgi:hypothetical protein